MPIHPHPNNPASSDLFTLERLHVIAIAVAIFVLPLLMWPGLSDYNYTKSIAALAMISGLLILWGLSAWRRPSWRIHIPWVLIPAAGLLLAGILSLIQATNVRVVIQSLTLLAYFVLLLWMIANIVRDQRDVQWILVSLLASASLAALYGVLQYYGLLPGLPGETGTNAILSTMGNRNHLGGFLLYLFYPAIILLVRSKSQWAKALTFVAIASLFAVLLLVEQTATRIAFALVTVALGVGWAIFRPSKPLRNNRWWLLGLACVVVIMSVFTILQSPIESPEEMWENNSGDQRTLFWWIGAGMFMDHPITGVGLGNYKLNFIPSRASLLATPRGQVLSGAVTSAVQAHNDVVQIGAELGIIGLIMLFGSLGTLAVSLWVRLKQSSKRDRIALLLLTAGIAAFLAHSLVSFPAHVVGSSLELIVFCGLALSIAYGTSMSCTWELRGWKARGVHLVFIVVGLTVSTFALADVRANWLMERGIDQVQTGLFATGESTLRRSLALDYAPRQTYYYLAIAQIQLGKLDEAEDSLEKCLTRFIDDASLLNYANLLVNTGQSERAFEPLDLLLASHPRDDIEPRALYLRALAISETGDPERAILLIEELIANNPRYETPHIGLGSVYESLDRIEEARSTYDEGLKKVEASLARTRAAIAALGETPVATKRNELEIQIGKLTNERATLLERLRVLPESSSP